MAILKLDDGILMRLRIQKQQWRRALAVLAAFLCLFPAAFLVQGQENGYTEYQIKALFLFNFAKYVQWPQWAFPRSNSPITIGVVGDDNFGGDLPAAILGKSVEGRAFVIRHLSAAASPQGCQILFISGSESSHMKQILDQAAGRPILTVGEDKAFSDEGGMIDFVLKDGRVRLEINLEPAGRAGLKISSKLLAVADTVTGKAAQR